MNSTALLSHTKSHSAVTIFADYLALTKFRLVSMVLLSTFTGFYLGSFSSLDSFSLLITLAATALVASGAMALNQFLERDLDAKMTRTQNRPIPAGRMEPQKALRFGLTISVLGFILFAFLVNGLSFFLAFSTWASYLFIYTPLKSKTSLSTLVGAIPGALPPAIGWTSANQGALFGALLLFLIIFFWQLPHFLSIAWIYRDDFARAKQPALSTFDDSSLVARQMIVNTSALIPVSLLLTIFGFTGKVYFLGAFILGISFAGMIIFAASCLDERARFILRSSIFYLAVLLLLMIFDKV
jgi:protoheme IX farnesyltransferase